MSDLPETVAELRQLSDEAASITESLRARRDPSDPRDDFETRLTWRMQLSHRLTILRERLAASVPALLDALDLAEQMRRTVAGLKLKLDAARKELDGGAARCGACYLGQHEDCNDGLCMCGCGSIRADNARLREALGPLVETRLAGPGYEHFSDDEDVAISVTFGDLRHARAALLGEEVTSG